LGMASGGSEMYTRAALTRAVLVPGAEGDGSGTGLETRNGEADPVRKQVTVTVVTSVPVMVPLPPLTTQVWAGLVGWVRTVTL